MRKNFTLIEVLCIIAIIMVFALLIAGLIGANDDKKLRYRIFGEQYYIENYTFVQDKLYDHPKLDTETSTEWYKRVNKIIQEESEDEVEMKTETKEIIKWKQSDTLITYKVDLGYNSDKGTEDIKKTIVIVAPDKEAARTLYLESKLYKWYYIVYLNEITKPELIE